MSDDHVPGSTPASSPGSDPRFVLSSARGTLVAHQPGRALSCRRADDLARCVGALFAEADPAAAPMLVGALPFARDARVHLFQPRRVERIAAGTPVRVPLLAGVHPATRWDVRAEPSREEYARRVAQALVRMQPDAGTSALLRKVVLGRRLLVKADRPIDVARVFARLAQDPDSTAYAVPLPPSPNGASCTLIGASPELLLRKTNGVVRSEPMAGSAPRCADANEDRAAAARLLESEKDLREHASVVEWVVDRLRPYCRRVRVPEGPSLKSTATMWHLVTPVEGDLLDSRISSIELATALHPTPAVGGVPQEAALEAIADLEPFDRGFFAGAVGWCDAGGDGEWLVTIRCGEVSGSTAAVYAGAGIVSGSDPEAEADETSAKLRTFLRALGIDEEGRPLPDPAAE